jgi:Winged helix DNA-binding domain
VTLRELNRTLLLRQLLLERRRLSLVKVVTKLVALQAQYAPSPYVALWARIEGFRKEQLTRALVSGTVVKAGSLRTTLHVMAREEFPYLAAANVESRRGQLPAVRSAPTGEWPHTKPSPFALWLEPLPDARESAIRVVSQYLAAYGPATRDDVVQYTSFKVRQIEPALDGLPTYEDDEGRTFYDLPRAPRAAGDVRAPVRFLPAFDSIILAHRDRARIVPPEYVDEVFNKKNATTKNTFTVDGFVAGAWRIERKRLTIEPFAPLPARVRREVDAEGGRLLAWYSG